MNILDVCRQTIKFCIWLLFLCLLIFGSGRIPSARAQGVIVEVPHCGAISVDETWSSGDIVHRVTCDVTIDQGVTLTISEGAIVKFDSEKSLVVSGKLIAAGTALNPIYFTSYKDDTIGGDTDGSPSFGARSDWEHIVFNSSSDDSSIIDHAVIRFSGDTPPYGGPYGGVHLLYASPTIQNTEITENQYCAISANMGSFPTLTNNNIHNNAANGFCLLGGTILIPPAATWNITNTSYFLRGDVTVPFGNSLTINPGVVVKLDAEKSLIVNGKLNVAGTSAQKVYFTSYKDDTVGGDTDGNGSSFGARSDWERILFNDSSDDTSTINHAVIRFSGDAPPYGGPYGGVHLLHASPVIQNTELAENQYCAISADMGSFPTLTSNSIHDNAANGFCLLGGDIPVTPATWNITNTSYFLRGDVTVPFENSLTINPGVVVKLDAEKSLIVNGKLTVPGTSAKKVYLTSYQDDTVGGDTNGNGSSFGAQSDWEHLLFNDVSDDTSLLDYAVVRFGGDAPPYGGPYGGIHLLGASPTIRNTTITDNKFAGVSASAANLKFEECNQIYNNDSYGLYNATPGSVITAENIWWGDPSGPSHAIQNPNGTGNAVSDGVDFVPWNIAACGTDITPPVVVSIVRADPNPTALASVHFTVTFSEPVTGVDTGDFVLVPTGLSGTAISKLTGTNATYTVTVATGTGNGTLRLDLLDNDSIKDASNNPLGGTGLGNGNYTSGEGYIVQKSIFFDVPTTHWAWSYIESIYKAGITGGCSTSPLLLYCPGNTVTRAQMAVFLLRAEHGSNYKPPAATGMFTDVPKTDFTAPFIEQLANEGITGGCGAGKYCPGNPVTRAQMAVFLLRAEHGSTYKPPAATGMFTDVVITDFTAPFIEQLANEKITGGCGGTNYCPGNPVTRDQMAVFLVRTFKLP